MIQDIEEIESLARTTRDAVTATQFSAADYAWYLRKIAGVEDTDTRGALARLADITYEQSKSLRGALDTLNSIITLAGRVRRQE